MIWMWTCPDCFQDHVVGQMTLKKLDAPVFTCDFCGKQFKAVIRLEEECP